MSLLRLSKLRVGKPALVRSCLVLSNGFSSSLHQTPPCSIIGADYRGTRLEDDGKLVISYANGADPTLDKKVPSELMSYRKKITVGSSHGWVATLKDDGVLRLQDDFNPVASDSEPKRIPLPPLVTLPHCQTQVVTNVSMSSSSPEDEDCVVAVKFLGPQLSFCRPAQRNKAGWTNIRIENPCFHSSRVMFSKKDEMFRIPGSGGHLIASWTTQDPNPMFQKLRFQNLPRLTLTRRKVMDSCTKTEHLVESQSTGETFLLKWYKKTGYIRNTKGMAFMKTRALMVFKLDGDGNALYTQDIGDLCIFLSKSEPFCVPSLLFPGMFPNHVKILDVDEVAMFDLADSSVITGIARFAVPYHIPPQDIHD